MSHTYVTVGSYDVTLTVTDDDGQTNSATTTATISGDDVLDLDIAGFKVSRSARVGKAIAIELAVANGGTVLGQARATVQGVQNGNQIYSWRLNVYDYLDKGNTTFKFPSYTPTSAGNIVWSVEIADVDPDDDAASAATVVR